MIHPLGSMNELHFIKAKVHFIVSICCFLSNLEVLGRNRDAVHVLCLLAHDTFSVEIFDLI